MDGGTERPDGGTVAHQNGAVAQGAGTATAKLIAQSDEVGRAILGLDYLWLFLAVIVLIPAYGLLSWWRRFRGRSKGSFRAKLTFGIITITGGVISAYTGLKLIAVLILTRPPAIDQLESLDRLAIGAVGGLILLFFPLYELGKFFSK